MLNNPWKILLVLTKVRITIAVVVTAGTGPGSTDLLHKATV